MTASTRFQLPSHVMQQQIAHSTVLLNIKSGEYFELNHSGALILAGVLSGHDLSRIGLDLMATFKLDAARAQTDIVALLHTLQAAGLLEAR
jgi:Coenzyme PQQ synthesis protein D (PqqD)